MTQSTATKVVHLIRPKDGRLSPLEIAFMTYEDEVCTLVQAVQLVQLAEDSDERYGTCVLQLALDNLTERAAKLKAKWYEDHGRIFKRQS
jgi:hypothetical protein